MKTTKQTLATFAQSHGINIKSVEVSSNPSMPEWDSARHYKVTLTRNERRMTIYFSQGLAHTESPKLEDVLNCLVLDASGLENSPDFENWCSEYGYSTDRRKAEKTFNLVQRQSAKLVAFLGGDLYQEILETL